MKKLHALEFSLTIGCIMDCRYCPQKLLLQKYYGKDKNRESKLSFENFKSALNQVREGAEISFAGMSEPFANRECADMIVYAHEQGYKVSLLTTAVGMTKEDYEKIKGIPFDSFVLHIPDIEMRSKIPITEEYLEILQLVVNHIDVDYYSCHGTVHTSVAEIIDKSKYAGIALGNRAGNLELDNYPATGRKQGRIVCYHGSEHQVGGWAPVMFPDGTLVLCCMDYGMKHVLGNLLKSSWETISVSKEYLQFKNGLDDDSADILCRFCTDAVSVECLPSMKIREIVERISNGNQNSKDSKLFVDLAESKTIAAYGMGKLFSDHFFQEHWDEGLKVSVLSDRSISVRGNSCDGIICVPMNELKEYRDLTVIVFVKNVDSIRKDLNSIGVQRVYSIDEVVRAYESVIGKQIKW